MMRHDIPKIAFHVHKAAVVRPSVVPVFYAVAMATGALTSLVFGSLLDRFGLPVLLLVIFI
ncbi:MAG: hypothetical protein ACM3VT_19535 [Solirubrobacterales bacterium]